SDLKAGPTSAAVRGPLQSTRGLDSNEKLKRLLSSDHVCNDNV
ncbi:unnamed protein product, partial [marine sediment metagenome]